MEGAGEGVVAILQGTKHAGLRVTLIPDNRLRSKRKCVLMDLGVRPPTRITQSSVVTNTDRVFKNASEPMCDVRYASSYQFGNCKSVQSSFRVSEFPQHNTFYRHSDHFADSLRKYPIQASSEILQRIINYTNIKQNTRKHDARHNARSMRSSLRKSTSQQMNRRYESGVNTNEIHTKRPINKSISVIGSRYSSQKELLNYTYDYLKCISLIPRCTDVRYLTQVKRCIRNRLLEIIDDRPAICPRIRSRYSQHKRYFHGPVAKPIFTSNASETQEASGTAKFTHMACTNPTHSRRKTCFCHQPKKCNCTSQLNKQNPLESLLRKLYPELNVNKTEIPSKQLDESNIRRDLTKLHNDVDDDIMRAVTGWLKSIPVYPNFSSSDKIKQEELAHKLAENLSSLKNHVDFISKAKMEAMSCLKELPMWYPSDLNEKDQFLDQIVDNLLKRLANILDDELKQKIAEAVSNLSYTEDVDPDKIVDDVAYKIKSIVSNPPEDQKIYNQILKPRIIDILNKLPIRCSVEKIQDVADKLVKQLKVGLSKSDENVTEGVNKLRENILKWCETVPEFENIDFVDNKHLIDDLADKLKCYESRLPKEETLYTELIKTIRNWLDVAANTINLRINSRTKNKLSNKMANHFFGKDYNNTLNKRKSSEISTSEEALEPLLKWYHGIQELAGGKRAETIAALDRLAEELKDVKSRDYNLEDVLTDMKEVVTVWLNNILTKRGKHLEPKDFDNFVNQLISDLNDIPKRKKQRLRGDYGQFYRDIVSWMKDIPYLKPESHLNCNKIIENFVNKLNNIRNESYNETKIIQAVTKFAQSLSENLEVRIHERDIKILMDKIFERLMPTSKQRKRWSKVNDICQSMLTEFSNILKAYSNILDNPKQNNIKDKFYSKIIENVEENGSPRWKSLLRQLNDIFKEETNFPEYDCEDLANTIITKMQRMFPHETNRRSTILSQPVKAYVEPARIIEQNNASKKYKTQKVGGRPESASSKNKNKKSHHRKVNLQAGDGRKNPKHSKMSTIYKSSNSDLDLHDSVDYNDNDYDFSMSQNDHSELGKHEEFRTSTPVSAALKNFPTALDNESPIKNITGEIKTLLEDNKFSKQPHYLNELEKVITDWVKNLDSSINTFDLNDLVEGIVSDVIDRQKYLQLSETKHSENEELEHLKYQIYRKLNKLKKTEILPQAMSKINSLYRCIRNISFPDLIKQANESQTPTTSVIYSSTFDIIKNWLDRVSSNLLKSSNIKQNPALINKLVKNLENVELSNKNDYEIERDILLWLQNLLRDANDKMFYEMAEDLKSNLINASSKTSNTLNQDTSGIIDEDISKVILAWLQVAKFYKSCTSEVKKMQEILALLLATNLTNILEDTRNKADNLTDLLIEEVQKYLKTIPMAVEFRNNNFYQKAAFELIEHLKQKIDKIKEIYDGITNIEKTQTETNTLSDFIDYKDLVKDIIKNWCDNLPIHLGHTSESKENAKQLKHNIAIELLEKLSNINLKDSNNDINFGIMLTIEIDNIFNNVPMNRELERSLPILKSILIEKLKEAKNYTQSLVPKKILQDTLTKTLQEIENTPDLERASLNLLKEKLADAFINLHYNSLTDFESRDKLKEILYNEITKFCNDYLDRYPYSPLDSDELRFNLYATLKKVLIPDKHFDTSDESPKLSSEKGVMLKNATTQYTSPQFLPSTLSMEDKAHLKEIRKRAAGYAENSQQPYKDLSSQLKETGVQTDSKENVEENVQTSKTLLSDTISYSKEILPQVVIKEYYWDTNGSKQSLKMFVPPALTPHKIIPRKKETNNSQNQTETNVINNSTKVQISQQLPDTREARSNKVDKASDAISQDNYLKQEQVNNTHVNNTHVNSHVQESHNNQTFKSSKDSIHKQRTEKPLHLSHRRCDTRVFDNGIPERYWIEQRAFDNDRYTRKESRQPNYLDDFGKIPDDRRILTQRIFLTPENRNKENMYCDHNASWRMGADVCRRRCNNTLKHCSKCCGGFCPHPTFAFFKKTL